jgi:hypothetical protein
MHAMLVDRHLHRAHRIWAIVAAFGDNLGGTAVELARPLGLRRAQVEQLRELGETLNYNGYGDCQGDLIVQPIALYRTLARHRDPFAFIGTEPVFAELAAHRRQDMGQAMARRPAVALGGATVYILPDAPWSRRVRGVFANELANRLPQLAHAVLTPNTAGGFTISLRTPKVGADALCRQFPTGGGRAIAAGINALPPDRVSEFVRRLDEAFPG